MLYFLFGPETYLRDEFTAKLCEKHNLKSVKFDINNVTRDVLEQADLFNAAKANIVFGLNAELLENDSLEKYKQSSNHIVFWTEKIDKRLSYVKNIFIDEQIVKSSCETPVGAELKKWVEIFFKSKSLQFETGVVNELIARITGKAGEAYGFREEAIEYSLLNFKNEIDKISAYANGQAITLKMVELLTPRREEAHIFKITEAVAEKNVKLVERLLENYYSRTDIADEKIKTIQFSALLAEQFRNILIIKELLEDSVSDSEIGEQTNWKSVRVKIMKNLARNFSRQKLVEILTKLENLDIELKTGTIPPRVLLEVILVQVA